MQIKSTTVASEPIDQQHMEEYTITSYMMCSDVVPQNLLEESFAVVFKVYKLA